MELSPPLAADHPYSATQFKSLNAITNVARFTIYPTTVGPLYYHSSTCCTFKRQVSGKLCLFNDVCTVWGRRCNGSTGFWFIRGFSCFYLSSIWKLWLTTLAHGFRLCENLKSSTWFRVYSPTAHWSYRPTGPTAH